MADRELNLIKRKKSALVKSLDANILKEVDAAIGGDDVDSLKGLIKLIDESLVHLTSYNDKIYDFMLASGTENDETTIEKEMSDDMTFKLRAQKCRARIESAVKGKDPPTPIPTNTKPSEEEPTTRVTAPQRRAKVPDLKIPTFGGSYLEWDTFKETFDALIGDKEYTGVEKFQYLRTYLTGTTKQLIEGFPTIGPNYAPAYKILIEWFGATST